MTQTRGWPGRVLLAGSLLAWATGPAPTAAGAPDLPRPPAGWRLEVVLGSPRLRHPSVVCCAPDGRVFVAEDPMDISAPRADLRQGRILCLHPDGRVTTFADRLHAVFGMQYIDGRLLVLHNPEFCAFTDGGDEARDKRILIASTNPNPWALDWNDHVPANSRLAMDGYLYVAVGDKGVYGAVGTDGRRVDLYGGGVLRLRPDGTDLEVYCTGVRNILDVALDAEDEIFTYDNTDEHDWMSRLTHMVDGGEYGYPFDFVPRRPYTLWMMADYGGGAATGALCYTEDALPAEYRGNLFLADFGKRQVLRVVPRRDGATFRADSRSDVFSDPPGDFRPVGIAVAPDGLGLYICDWQHADTKEAVSVGRLLRLTYTGPSHARTRPSWFLDAACGRPCRASLDELVVALSHPARSVREVAQRRLAERGTGAVAALVRLLGDVDAPAPARWHALWALDAIDGGVAGRSAILAAVADGEPSVRRQALRQLGTRRVREAGAVARDRLRDADAGVRFRAAAALGRIGDAAAVPALIEALDEADAFARYAAFTALNRIGRADPAAWPAIAAGLVHPRPIVRDGVGLALRETHDPALADALAGLSRDRQAPAQARARALRLLAAVHRRRPAWKGEWWAYHPALTRPPAKSEAWDGTPTVLAALREGVADPDPGARLAGVDGLRDAGATDVAAELRSRFPGEDDPGVRRALLAALGAFRDEGSRGLIAAVLRDPRTGPGLAAEAIDAAGRVGGEDVAEAVRGLLGRRPGDPSFRVAAIDALGRLGHAPAAAELEAIAGGGGDAGIAACEALAAIGGDAGRDALLRLADRPELEVRRGAVAALGRLGPGQALPRLLAASRDPETRSTALSALTRMPDARALDAYLEGLGGRDASLREACARAIARIRDEALPRVEAQADRLPPAVVRRLRRVYEGHAEAARGRLFAVDAEVPPPEEYEAYARDHTGDPARGRALFHDRDGPGCVKCHRVGGAGGDVGPELTSVGDQLDRARLAEAVLDPSRSIREGYQQVTVATADGRVVAGLVRSESADVLTLRDAEGRDHAIPKAEIEERAAGPTSLMPEGLHSDLAPQDFADLLSYLESLKGTPESADRPGSRPLGETPR
ncbi:Cytochrome c [Tautonia plasticadhaerens]|uniref:Cytochrome c n=1 Tax=Tautonia plasticadhaerens TaxID=2527974 RepID=A0A518HAA1_9BACT|nr:Cytochrome c [Tautonia plasticadhaerens]